MHLFIEVLTLAFFLGTVAHAVAFYGRAGAAFFAALLYLGFVRENAVILRDVLYGFSPLHLMLGKAPLIASIIWGYSIYAAAVWAEAVSSEKLTSRRLSAPFLGLSALFMMALACFYEPFLALIDMAKWQEGTRRALDVPLIALIGYPSLTVLFLLLWSWARRLERPWLRTGALAAALPVLGVGHALGLQALKDLLGW